MASPFAIFRKHERILMATVGLMAILAFVFLGNIGQQDPGSNQGRNPVVATTKYGKVTAAELQWMQRQKQVANSLLQFAVFQRTGQFIQDYFDQPTPDKVIDTMILARKAADLGMYIGDDEITRFLRRESGDRLKADDYANILRQFNEAQRGRDGRVINKSQLYDILRTQLMCRHMQEMCFTGLESTPAERWDEYSKLRKRVSANVVPVLVADHLSKINDPSDAKLTEFYDKYKDVVAQPGLPTPGFRIPPKVQLAYFKADIEQFKKEVTITDEEVAAYYEKNKAMFPYRENRVIDDEPKDKPAETKSDADAKATDEKPTGEKPADEKPADGGASDAKSEEKPSEEKKPEEPKADAAADAPKQSADAQAIDSQAIAQDVDLCQDKSADEKAATDKPAADAPADKPATEAAKTEDATKAADAAKADAGKAPGGDAKSNDFGISDLKLDSAKLAPPADVEPLDVRDVLPEDVRDGPNPEHEPLWRVEKEIREQLSTEKAMEQITKTFAGLEEKMRRYSTELNKWEARKEEKNPPKEPAPLDFAALAAEAHVTTETTGLVNVLEFSKLPGIGESFVTGSSSMLWQIMFGPGQLFATKTSEDRDGNQYLSWKTKAEATRVPELKEIHADVVRAWKMIEARKPAREHAEALAEQARRDKITLADLAKKDTLPLEETGLFSWLTRGLAPDGFNQTPPRLTEVRGVEDAGNDFMKVVMDLPLDGIGVAPNNPESIFYVVQVTAFDPPTEVLRRSFLVDRYDYRAIGNPQRVTAFQAWNDAVRKEADLKWVDKPQTPDEEGDVAG